MTNDLGDDTPFLVPRSGLVAEAGVSLFMRSHFEENRNILFFPRRAEEVAEIVNGALDDLSGLQEMTDDAAKVYAAGHTWEHRVKAILDVFEKSP